MSSVELPTNFTRIVPKDRESDRPADLKETPLPKPGKNEVLIKMAFAPVNLIDIEYFEGGVKSPLNKDDKCPSAVGLEGSGEIVALGTDLKCNVQVGDKVHVLGEGTWGKYLVTKSDKVQKIEGGMSLELASTHLITPGMVHYMADLIERGGHKAAIHTAGAGTIGRVLIKYLKKRGVRLINIVSKDEQVEELMSHEGADYALNCKDPNFEKKLKELATKEKATIAFDAMGGDMTNRLLRGMPENSTVRVYGFLSGKKLNLDLGELFMNRTVSGMFFSYYLKDLKKSGKLQAFYDEIHKELSSECKPNILKVFPMDQYKEAMEYQKSHCSEGKVLLKLN